MIEVTIKAPRASERMLEDVRSILVSMFEAFKAIHGQSGIMIWPVTDLGEPTEHAIEKWGDGLLCIREEVRD